jgi:phage terminase small subunit
MTALRNAKHEAVIQAFIASKDRVGWKAYASVYKKSGQRAAEVAWSRLLKIAEFSARLAELEQAVVDQVVEKTGITVERVITELGKLGFANMLSYVRIDGEDLRLDFTRLTKDEAAAIQEITTETTRIGDDEDGREITRTKFKLADKRAALVDIGRHLKMFTDRHEHAGPGGGPITTKDATERLGELELARRIAFILEQGARAAAAKRGK